MAAVVTVTASCAATVAARPARAGGIPGLSRGFIPGNLLVSESVYAGNPGIVAGQTQLPPGCTTGCVTATAGGGYPQVFNNDLVDANFGVTSRIFLSELTPSGFPLGTVAVPANQLVTSFSSKSELALNLSPDGRTRLVHGLRGQAGPGGRVELQHPRCRRPDQPGAERLLPGGGAAVRRRADPAHRDQRLQRQQRPGGDHRRRPAASS